MIYLFTILIGYLVGSSNLAYFIARAKGFDIRSRGSMNAGASNATITLGLKFGIAAALHDIGKAFLVAFLAEKLFPALPYIGLVAGVAAVLGHIFPFYLKFKGGKGFASFLGLTLAVDWRFFLIITVTVLVITIITDYIALGTLTTITLFPAYLGWTTQSTVAVCIVCVASAIICIKHLINLQRIFTGQEIGLRKALRKK